MSTESHTDTLQSVRMPKSKPYTGASFGSLDPPVDTLVKWSHAEAITS